MEINCRKLEQIVNSDDPLNALKQNVGNKSLKEWLKFGYGDALNKCMETNLSEALKYLSIVDAIIPPVPKFMVNKVHEIIFKTSTPREELDQLQRLIYTLKGTFFTMINDINFPKGIGSQVLLKFVYYADKRSMKDYSVKLEICQFIKSYLGQYCSDFTEVALNIILFEKLPEMWLQDLFEPRYFIKTKMIVMQNGLQQQFYGSNLEEKFYLKFPTLRKMHDIVFNEKCLTTSLRSLAQIINENQNLGKQFLIGGLMHKFHSLLCNPSKFGDKTFVIKSFLTVFLCFETDSGDGYTWKRDLFKTLVETVAYTLDSLFKKTHTPFDFGFKDTIDSKYLLNNLVNLDYLLNDFDYVCSKNDIVVALELLQSLHVLNSTWHQWFDIVIENKVIKDCMFENLGILNYMLYNGFLIFKEYLFYYLKKCPALISMENKNEIFKNVSTFNMIRYFEVSRSSVLNDITEQIRLEGDFGANYHWDISFKDENGIGTGVTKEVYSILSDELQKHFGLSQFETVEVSDNKVIHAQTPNGALEKLDKEIERFELLGKIMAKAIIDKQFLNISFCNRFFRWLRTTHFKNYSHLKRDYFDLIETFPVLETLFKQLLPVKRKIEAIRSDVDLSEHQKKEIISNLTFEDGNTFDDLCLNFTVPGTDIELIEGGRDVLLSPHNIDLYFEKLCAQNIRVYSAKQFEAVKAGFDKVFYSGSIDCLLPEELEILFCGEEIKRWTEEDLKMHCVYEDSPSVQFLFRCLSKFDPKRQKLFLGFVTGRTFLPRGGLSGLDPPLTISTKYWEDDAYLPSAATCRNRLYLPDYSSIGVTKQKLLYAIEEGNNSFGLV